MSGRQSSDGAQLRQVRGGSKAAGLRGEGAQTRAAGAGEVLGTGGGNGRGREPGARARV